MKRIATAISSLLLIASSSFAQQNIGTSGLMTVATAETGNEGDARVGAHYINKEMTPDFEKVFCHDGEKYNTGNFYLSITPFRWVQVSYNVTLLKRVHYKWTHEREEETGLFNGDGYHEKDQYFSLKLQPLREKEGHWWPSVAVGGSDFIDSHGGSELYFGNVYLALSKSFKVSDDEWGINHHFAVHATYRRYFRDYNHRWNGLVGGVSYRNSYYEPLRLMAEWDGNQVNVGADCLFFNHLLVQAALHRGRYFSGGLCYQVNLFGNNKY